jgi:hypothetical protein
MQVLGKGTVRDSLCGTESVGSRQNDPVLRTFKYLQVVTLYFTIIPSGATLSEKNVVLTPIKGRQLRS